MIYRLAVESWNVGWYLSHPHSLPMYFMCLLVQNQWLASDILCLRMHASTSIGVGIEADGDVVSHKQKKFLYDRKGFSLFKYLVKPKIEICYNKSEL